MSVETFTKQSREQFTIWGSILDVQETSETVTLGSSTVTVTDKDGKDAGEVVDQSSKIVDTDPDGTAGETNNMLGIKVRNGEAAKSPYWITFLMVTSASNTWEVDVKMKVKETPSFPAVSTTTTT